MDSYKNECRGYNLHDAVEDAKLSSTASTDVQTLMRRCGVEMNEAIFLLEASDGDVRAASRLHGDTALWAAPATRGRVGSLTAATDLALAKVCISPPEDTPASPDSCVVWPTMKQADAAQADDWDLIETFEDDEAPRDGTDWVEIDTSGEETPAKTSFKDVVGKSGPSTGPMLRPCVPPLRPKAPARAADTMLVGSPEQPDAVFAFDEDELMQAEAEDEMLMQPLQQSQRRAKRDGHSKNSKKGSRAAANLRRAAAGGAR